MPDVLGTVRGWGLGWLLALVVLLLVVVFWAIGKPLDQGMVLLLIGLLALARLL